ncbi:GTPase IMAP family member 9-like [Littorina saxatilis]|uniref:GTPase IMAP family member 9-like n=1 Tax=Littorina saxatilis TaxID=31220 RepID=UPI0038B46525
MTSNAEDSEYRILVIGKAGNGKSSVCNTLLGSEHFPTGRSFSSTTLEAQEVNCRRNGRCFKVVDTPDVVNLDLTLEDMEEEVSRWKDLTLPHPSAVLLTVRCDVRYTPEEYAIYRQILKLWGDDTLKRHLVVTFTFGDRQDEDIRQTLQHVCPQLKSVLKDANGRFVVFDNKARDKDCQRRALFSLLDTDSSLGERHTSPAQQFAVAAVIALLAYFVFTSLWMHN